MSRSCSNAPSSPLAIPQTGYGLLKERRDRKKNHEIICTSHDKIHDAAERILRYDLLNLCINDVSRVQMEIHELASYIVELTEYARERGQAMEDRLSDYYNTITALGFKREGRTK